MRGDHALIDTHIHLVPGADDGAGSVAQALGLVRASLRCGCTQAVAVVHATGPETPGWTEVEHSLGALAAAMEEQGLSLSLVVGYEVDAVWASELPTADLRQFSIAREGRVIIIETPHYQWLRGMEDLVFRLRVDGLVPVLAHPERNPHLQAHPEVLTALVDQGAVVQITAPSVLGAFGSAAQKAAIRHVLRGDVALLASDAHYERRGKADLGAALLRLRRLLHSDDVDALVHENAAALVEGHSPAPIPAVGTTARLGVKLRSLVW